MAQLTTTLIARIGETDQLYLNENTPKLALERADLRLQLVVISHLQQEQVHFLNEAIVCLRLRVLNLKKCQCLYILNCHCIWLRLT